MKIDKIISDIFKIPIDEVTDDLGPKTTKAWTSLKHFQLITSLEKIFQVRFQKKEIRALKTIKDVKIILQEKGVIIE